MINIEYRTYEYTLNNIEIHKCINTCAVVLCCKLQVFYFFFFLLQTSKVIPSANCRKMGAIGKWFHQKQHGGNYYKSNNITVKKKDRARLENARVHSAVSIAGLASALAAVAAAENSTTSGSHSSKLNFALASATQLLASHCIEMAELAGADHDRVASIVKSAVDIHTPGDLMTLTAAAATGTCLLMAHCFHF